MIFEWWSRLDSFSLISNDLIIWMIMEKLPVLRLRLMIWRFFSLRMNFFILFDLVFRIKHSIQMDGSMKCWVFFLSIIRKEYFFDQYFVLNIACNINCFCPKVFRKWVFTEHGSSNLFQSFIFPFNYPILPRCSRWREVVENTILFTKWPELSIFKLISMVTPDREEMQKPFHF